MKYAGGCFGCLTLIFIVTGVVLAFGSATIMSMVAGADPEAAQAIAPFLSYFSIINNGCCCLSGVLAVVLLAVGMSKKDESGGE